MNKDFTKEANFITQFFGEEKEALQLVERQTCIIESNANVVVTLCGILIAITAAGLSSGEQMSSLARWSIGLGTFFALIASGVAIFRIFTVKWASTTAFEQTNEPKKNLILMLLNVRYRKTKALHMTIMIVLMSLLFYTLGVVIILMRLS